MEDILTIFVDSEDPNKALRIGAGLPADEKDKMIKFLSDNLDIFAWCTSDMPGIDPGIICHCLSIREGSKPVKQKARRINAEQS